MLSQIKSVSRYPVQAQCEGQINTVNKAQVYINKHVLIRLLMSSKGCPGWLTGGTARPLMCTASEIGGFDRSPPRTSRKLHKVICVLHICYLSASPSLTFWIRSPTSLPCRFLPLALSLLLSGGHPCPRHLFLGTPHTETEGGRDAVL